MVDEDADLAKAIERSENEYGNQQDTSHASSKCCVRVQGQVMIYSFCTLRFVHSAIFKLCLHPPSSPLLSFDITTSRCSATKSVSRSFHRSDCFSWIH